jgi:anti-sigma B factor antagonist
VTHSSAPFTASVVTHDGVDSVVLTGELDMASSPDLAVVLEVLILDGPVELVIDLSGLSFIDSSGLAVLVAAQNALAEKGRRLSVRSARRHAVRVFEIAGLGEFLDVRAEPTEKTLSSE